MIFALAVLPVAYSDEGCVVIVIVGGVASTQVLFCSVYHAGHVNFAYAVAFADAGAEKSKSVVYHVEVYQPSNVQLVFVGF